MAAPTAATVALAASSEFPFDGRSGDALPYGAPAIGPGGDGPTRRAVPLTGDVQAWLTEAGLEQHEQLLGISQQQLLALTNDTLRARCVPNTKV